MQKSKLLSHILVLSEQLPAVVPHYCQPPGAGALSRDFTTNLAPQCRAFSGALKNEKLNAPLFLGPRGAGDTNDWCIIRKNTFISFCMTFPEFRLEGFFFIFQFNHRMGICL